MHSNETKTSEQIVRERWPKAFLTANWALSQRYRIALSVSDGEQLTETLGRGKTEAEAWDDAARRLEAEQPAEPQSEGGEERDAQ